MPHVIQVIVVFDADRCDVAPEVRTANEQLDAAGDPWGVASRWVSRNDRLESLNTRRMRVNRRKTTGRGR